MNPFYRVYLYNNQGGNLIELAEITQVVHNLSYDVLLNNISELSLEIKKNDWLNYCEATGLNPYLSLLPFTKEIKIKRNGVFLPFSFEIKKAPKKFDVNIESQVISITAQDTLSKFLKALSNKSYTNIDSCIIARDLITTFQARQYANRGVTMGNTYNTGVLSTRNYSNYSVAEAIKNLSDDTSGGFDFWFDENLKFYTASKRGSLRDSVVYRFSNDPYDKKTNCTAYENPEDGSGISNNVIVVGEGIGNPITATALDVNSATTYGLQEIALVHSDIKNVNWLQNKANAELRDRKDIYDLPSITTSGEFFNVAEIWVGDTIQVECLDPSSPYTGYGRIKKMKVDVSDLHTETISLELIKVA